MSMKKKALMGASYVLVAAMAIGGTVAYLTDRDNATNIFTLGNVDIELSEDFEQGAELIPGVKVDKKPTITNVGKSDAYVWMTIAVPTGLDTINDASANVLHWNPLGATWDYYSNQTYLDKAIENNYLPEGTTMDDIKGKTWNITDSIAPCAVDAYTQDINGEEYTVYTMLYNDVLSSGEKTLPSLVSVYLDTAVDIAPNGDMYKVVKGEATSLNWNIESDGAPMIFVNAYGIQAEGFENVEDAYKAFMGQWEDEEGNMDITYEMPTEVTSSEEISTAIANGATLIKLAEGNYTIPADAVKGKEVFFVGTGEDTVVDCTAAQNVTNAKLNFSNLKIQGVNKNYIGYQHAASAVYENCVIDSRITLYASDVRFDNCEFRLTGDYVWTYGADNVEFNNCVFNNTDSKAILVYQENDTKVCNVTVNDCTFNADAQGKTGSGDWTAAIEIDSSLAPANVVVENCTADENYNGLVRNKKGENTTITIDGVDQPLS